MKVKTLTDRYITGLKPKDRPYTVFEDKFDGCFGVQVRPTGRKSFLTVYHAKGRQNWVVVRAEDGRSAFPDLQVAEARDLAADILSDVRRDKGDPAEARRKRREARTVRELVDAWEADLKTRGARRAADMAKFVRTYAADLLDRKVCDADEGDVKSVLKAVAEGRGLKRGKPAPTASNRLRTLLHGVFAFAVEEQDLTENPVQRLPKKKRCKEVRRQHVPSVTEFKALWGALDTDASPVTAAMLRLAAYTGARIWEVRSLKWSDLDLTDALWILRAEVAKNGKSRRIPLSRQAVALLEGVKGLGLPPSEYVFPKAFGDGPKGCRGELWGQVQDLKRKHPALADFVGAHDLRRFIATRLEELRVRRAVVAELLGHTDTSITANYAKPDFILPMRAAVQAFADWVDGLLADRPEETGVVPFGRTAEAPEQDSVVALRA